MIGKSALRLLSALEKLRRARTVLRGVDVDGFKQEDIAKFLPEGAYGIKELDALVKARVLKRLRSKRETVYVVTMDQRTIEHIIEVIMSGKRRGKLTFDLELKNTDDDLPDWFKERLGSTREALVKNIKRKKKSLTNVGR